MDLQLLSQVFLATLDTDNTTREAAETHLRELKPSLEVFSACLKISIDNQLGYYPAIQQSAIVYLKNIVRKRWKRSHDDGSFTPRSDSSSFDLQPDQRDEFKQQVLYSLHMASPEVLSHLIAIIAILISADFPHSWPELVPTTISMLQSSDSNSVYCGVLCCTEILKFFSLPTISIESRNRNLDSIVSSLFPLLYRIAAPLAVDSHDKAGLILWKILKAYKFAIAAEFPQYLQQDEQLKNWLYLWMGILQRPIQFDAETSQNSANSNFSHKPSHSTSSISSNSSSFTLTDLPLIILTNDSSLHAWIKCKKWACFIHTRLMTVHATLNSKTHFKISLSNPAFSSIYLSHFAPGICNILLNEIRVWKAQSNQTVSFLSLNQSLINLYDYFEAALPIESLWNILLPNMELIISDLVLKTLILSESDIELLHNQPEEYILTNIENAEFTPRTNASKFLKKMIKIHQDQILEGFFEFINQIMSKHQENRNDFQLSLQRDAALQMISAIRVTLLKSESPFTQQMESFMIQQVSLDTTSQHSFLRARACELISKFGKLDYSTSDLKLLFNQIMECLNDSEVVVRFQAIMAIQTLINYPAVCPWLAGQVSQVMHKMMEIYNDVDSERISLVMEDLIEIFSEQLSPFAVQLSEQLSNQFIRINGELLIRDQNQDEYGYIDDKNMAALGILNAFSTLLFSLEKSPALVSKVEVNLLPILKIVIENSQEAFYQEVFELIEECLSCTMAVTDTMAKVLGMIEIGFKSNPTYGADYYIPCLCNFVKYGNRNNVMVEGNVKFFFEMALYYAAGRDIPEDEKRQACSFAQVIILKCSELGPNNYVDYYVSQLLQYCTGELPAQFEPAIYRRVLNIFVTAVFYNPQGVTQFLSERNYLSQLLEGLMNHTEIFARPYEKKLVTLSLLRLLGTKFSTSDTIVRTVFQIVPIYALSHQKQVEKESLKETGGFAPVQFSFVDETFSTQATFQQYGKSPRSSCTILLC